MVSARGVTIMPACQNASILMPALAFWQIATARYGIVAIWHSDHIPEVDQTIWDWGQIHLFRDVNPRQRFFSTPNKKFSGLKSWQSI